jgi:DNA-binding NtrC family response regulator
MNSKKQESNSKLIGVSEHIKYLKNEIEKVAQKIKTLDMAVLISGPSGTGKELIAKAIAKQSGLKLVTVNSGAIPPELFEPELFGFEKGAFTGALRPKKGLVEEAQDGILFLDEIGNLLPHHQAKLLRFLEDKSFKRVGDNTQRFVKNVKIISATNKDLTKAVSEKNFREDLFTRINHRIIQTIPLKNRREDIICLVNHFVHKTKVKIDPKVKLLLYSYDFPGNVRELESLIYSSDDFQYIKNALRNIVASSVGIPAEFISGFESLKDYDFYTNRTTDDMFRKRNGDEVEGESLFRERLSENADAYEFFRATFFAEENDCSKMVEAYEIMTLKLCQGLSRDNIRELLHSDTLILSPNGFKEAFGFDFSIKDDIFNYTEPLKLYPSFSNYWGYILRSKEPNP